MVAVKRGAATVGGGVRHSAEGRPGCSGAWKIGGLRRLRVRVGCGDRRTSRCSVVPSNTSWAYQVAHITFIAPPPGEAPESVRRGWVGLTVPVTAREARARERVPSFGVLSGPRGPWRQIWAVLTRRAELWSGYAIESRKCIAHLREHAPDAAAWWAESAPRYLEPGRYFLFPTECCKLSQQ